MLLPRPQTTLLIIWWWGFARGVVGLVYCSRFCTLPTTPRAIPAPGDEAVRALPRLINWLARSSRCVQQWPAWPKNPIFSKQVEMVLAYWMSSKKSGWIGSCWTVTPFVTAHTFCASAVWSEILGFWLPIQRYFCAVCDYVEKADLRKGYRNREKKLGVTTHFSEVIELKLGKKMPCILCILKLFENFGCFIIIEKCVVTHTFLYDSNNPC